MIDCNEWRTEKRHERANMGKVKRLELWWQLYRTSLPVWDLENFRSMDFCWHECTCASHEVIWGVQVWLHAVLTSSSDTGEWTALPLYYRKDPLYWPNRTLEGPPGGGGTCYFRLLFRKVRIKMYRRVINLPAVLYKCKHLPLKLRGRKQIQGDREQGTKKNVWV